MNHFVARCAVATLLIFLNVCAQAQGISTFVNDRQLGVVLDGTEFPESLGKDLMSGLTNRVLIRITLEPSGQAPRQRSAEIAIRYDLWDEAFICLTTLDGGMSERTTQRNVQEVMEWLDHLRLPGLFPTSNLSSTTLLVRAELLLNPIDRERMENLRKWVAENSKRRPLDPAGALGVTDTSLANALFNKIFEQYASGSEFAAVWQQSIASRTFTLETLPDDGR